ASKAYLKPTFKEYPQKQELLSALKDALYAAKIISYAQGFVLMRQAALSQGWKLNFGEIALMWRGGCIIRSAFLGKIKDAYDQNPQLKNLLLDPYFQEAVSSRIQSWRNVVSTAVLRGIAIPTLASGLSYFDGLTTEQLPANLLQAMRDYFGAHTYERIDQPRGKFFHTNWTGEGGDTSSTTYNV
ncbi:MAG: NADP-dependent phosphogluconate dehydrogenase, partial [Candidatus Izemoplasmatales bacterium]